LTSPLEKKPHANQFLTLEQTHAWITSKYFGWPQVFAQTLRFISLFNFLFPLIKLQIIRLISTLQQEQGTLNLGHFKH